MTEGRNHTSLSVRPSRTRQCANIAFGWLPGWRSRRHANRRKGWLPTRPKGAA